MHTAHADRRGIIRFSSEERVPDGVLVFAKCGNAKKLRRLVGVRARHAYDGKTLLVPGVPEADSDTSARKALEQWRDWAFAGGDLVDGARVLR